MRTRKNTIIAIMAALMVLITFMGCNKDGDETITLERGIAAKMLPGRWIIRIAKGTPPIKGWVPGTIVIFYPGGGNDGTFKTYPDGPSGKWSLPDGGDTPRIYIGGYEFGIESGGTIIWTCRYPYGNSSTPNWEGTLEKESDDTGVPAVVPDDTPDTNTRAVDLGLSVLWADRNVGATSASDAGAYFSWGETKTKSSYNQNNSSWYGKSLSELSALPGTANLKTICGSKYDAATASWGSKWRMPKGHEFDELIHSCTIKRETQGKITGFRFTGNNGNSIFMPMAGLKDGKEVTGYNVNFYYWAGESSYIGNMLLMASSLIANPDNIKPEVSKTNVYYGLPVRAVMDK